MNHLMAQKYYGINSDSLPLIFSIWIILALLVLSFLAVIARLEESVGSWLTLTIGLIAAITALMRPTIGIIFLLIALYFPLLPNISLEPVEFSLSTPIVVGLTLAAFSRLQKSGFSILAHWQWRMLTALLFACLLATFFSSDLSHSLKSLPNFFIYIFLLFSLMVLVDSKDKLWSIGKTILLLAFILSIWRIELRPIRYFFGLPSLGINGAAFCFHPAAGLSLAIAVLATGSRAIAKKWRIWAVLVFVSLVMHGILYESRAAWMAWAAIIFAMALLGRGRSRIAMILFVTLIGCIAFFYFQETIIKNIEQTQMTIIGIEEDDEMEISSDDRIRLYARNAGWRMFLQRPELGFGPGMYRKIKPDFVQTTRKEGRNLGAFNSWLLMLAEMGIVTALVAALFFILPIIFAFRALRKKREMLTIVSMGMALGVIGLGIHLFFIDLFFSFAWAHVGIALSAVKLVKEKIE